MAVSFRVVGTWAELTADGSVAIPATPQAGDRMYLLARWKDFSVTATVANWTELTEFADGAVSAGNGTGSVKVGCWYRDWQSGDTDPNIDFSASPDNASAVIMVMQKGVDDVWNTPVARTAAMTNWTTTSQIVSASASVAVPSGGVVMGLIGIRDDSATMTRPTSGIDDSAAVVTWNGNYVESPATHHSTTTGFDGAADLGYRLVSVGATATLRMTGTISAAETGAALWVIQGTTIVVTPEPTNLTLTAFTPTLQTSVTPAPASLELSTFAPTLRSSVGPSPALLGITSFSPLLNLSVVPASASFEISTFAPTLAQSVTPATANLTISTFSPSLLSAVTPEPQSLTITSSAPTLVQAVTPATFNLVLTTFRPSIWPPNIIFADPGGDATHAVGHFNADINETGLITYDDTHQVADAGSYKFDSDTGLEVPVAVNGVLGAARRGSAYFGYDLVPDSVGTATVFPTNAGTVYSGGGFTDAGQALDADGLYATAAPAKNSGQGSLLRLFNDFPGSIDAVIVSVKIVYQRKYDVDTSIGISRVKWRVNSEEGSDHDNTDQPTTDTVVTVDVTSERAWEVQDFLNGVFEVIAEARRGDTDTEHTQSWDYLKVEVVYHLPATIMAALTSSNLTAFRVAIRPKDDHAVLRFVDGAGNSYDGITPLLVDTDNRISFAYVQHASDDLDIKLYVNGIEELFISGASTGGLPTLANFQYGWLLNPGANHLCWFSHIKFDDGDDLTDPGNMLSTHKGPAAVSEDNWDTTGGTGAVNERPLSETNYKFQSGFSSVTQTYTLQAAAVGDVDISSKTIVGYVGWAWAKREPNDVERIGLIVNNVDVSRSSAITTSPSLLKHAVTSSVYPSHANGIGMSSNSELAGVFMLECGAVLVYEGPVNPDILLERQEVNNETLDTIIDDLRADPPDSYEVCCTYDDFDGTVEIVIHSLDQEGGSFQKQPGLDSKGRVRITPGIEVRLDVTVTGVTNLQIWRRINID